MDALIPTNMGGLRNGEFNLNKKREKEEQRKTKKKVNDREVCSQ